MIVASWNVNGIRAREGALESWVRQSSPDVLILQEVKASVEEIPLSIMSLDGYRSFWNDSSIRKGYSGTGILMKETPALEGATFEIPPFDIENRTVVLHTGELSIIGTYVPRGDSAQHYVLKLGYLEAMHEYVRELLACGRQILVTGDMNVAHRQVDLHRSENRPGATGIRPEERSAIDRLIALGLSDVMRELNPERDDLFTWWPYWRMARERNIGWRIDCFYLSGYRKDRILRAAVDMPEKSSDHAPIILEFVPESGLHEDTRSFSR
ncbi:exodeoxyribonuclease III [Pelodictyon luteolum]|uniref:AP endonuclease, family 1 n=1 Tax=Chlorobium luteolum (strain DSM 273 / BCRC 81028 / 2530) TaxID=319225 RepID=Q3B6M8_CHLL3|nr:exodeoxyribonuclease III [Pelodictyon luteolum]ABB23003.1 AP endonuclease, family 1 [Pelodictyon luteolum DSM 273]